MGKQPKSRRLPATKVIMSRRGLNWMQQDKLLRKSRPSKKK